MSEQTPLLWLEPGQAFPPVERSWGKHSPAPGLLAAGADLNVSTLKAAYAQGVFPWYNAGQPILWWAPEPRMVLQLERFKLHHSLKRTLKKFLATPGCEVRIDFDFPAVIAACANTARAGQAGTWIVEEMQSAYTALHQAGHAHSVETWVNGRLVGGLYCTTLGAAVFGESMFALATDTSKIALCALVALCKAQAVKWVDCQQNTRHLASFGAAPIPRNAFVESVQRACQFPALDWRMHAVYWEQLLASDTHLSK